MANAVEVRCDLLEELELFRFLRIALSSERPRPSVTSANASPMSCTSRDLTDTFCKGLASVAMPPVRQADARAREQLTVVEKHGASKSLQDLVGDYPREWDI